MKSKYIVDLSLIGLLILAFLYFQYYIPQSAVKLSQKIDQTGAGSSDSTRMNISEEYTSYLARWLPKNPETIPTLGHHYIGQQRKILDIRVEQAISEIKNIPILDPNIRVWSLLNMGAVIKSPNTIVSIDVANIPFLSNSHDELAKISDIFLLTHTDSDHFDQQLLKSALANNKKIVFLEGVYFEKTKENSQNIFELKSGQRTKIKDIFITAFQTDHRGDGNFDNPNCWYLIEIGKTTILHTGDGLAFKNPTESESLRSRSDIDIMLSNIMLSAKNIEEINPKVVVPLHLFKYIHGREQLSDSTFEIIKNKYEQIKPSKNKIIYLFAGEGFLY
jgi:L-ascorbate metabolism protein UlaG (beta-lactamase superfamily)